MVLDDPFSALDGNTEDAVVDNLLGSNGWFKRRNTAVFLVTNSGKLRHLPVNTFFRTKCFNSAAFPRRRRNSGSRKGSHYISGLVG